jgi:hypothetical protein
MASMRESWTDARLDDLNGKVDRGFERIDADLQAQWAESRNEFIALRSEMKAGFDRVDERFDAMYRLMIQLGGAMLAALIGLVATQL